MLDPCSMSSYVSEDAAEELELRVQVLNLTIAGSGEQRWMELTVASLDSTLSSPLQAHVLDNLLVTLQLSTGQN